MQSECHSHNCLQLVVTLALLPILLTIVVYFTLQWFISTSWLSSAMLHHVEEIMQQQDGRTIGAQ